MPLSAKLWSAASILSLTVFTAWTMTARDGATAPITPLHEPAGEVAAAPPSSAHGDTGITPPDLVVYGTFIDDVRRMALISRNGQAQEWFLAGQPFDRHFYLDNVHQDHIIVRDVARTLTLKIGITREADAGPPTPVRAMPVRADVTAYPPVEGIEQLDTHRYRIDRERLMRELESGDIFYQLRVVPEEKGGFFIERIVEGSLAETGGLRVGDTINKVNDKPLNGITDALNLYKQLDTLNKLDIEIHRRHQTEHLQYELD